jgi:hypothetical protein
MIVIVWAAMFMLLLQRAWRTVWSYIECRSANTGICMFLEVVQTPVLMISAEAVAGVTRNESWWSTVRPNVISCDREKI